MMGSNHLGSSLLSHREEDHNDEGSPRFFSARVIAEETKTMRVVRLGSSLLSHREGDHNGHRLCVVTHDTRAGKAVERRIT
jgi:hypothetical protein